MATKSKTRGANLPVPQSREEAAQMLARIGEASRDLTRIETDMNARLAEIKAAAEAAAAPLRERVAMLTEALKTWCEAHRAELTGGRSKTADLGTGTVSWRLRPAAVRIAGGVEAMVERLKALGLGRFVRVKEDVNKEALRAEPDVVRAIPGLTIGSEGEDFVAEPFEAALATPAPGGAA